jgi:hypothetical protein
MNPIIQSARLDLIPMPAVLRAVLAGDHREAGRLFSIAMPEDCQTPRGAMALRLSEPGAKLALQPWLLKATALREQSLFVAHVGFHMEPGAAITLRP